MNSAESSNLVVTKIDESRRVESDLFSPYQREAARDSVVDNAINDALAEMELAQAISDSFAHAPVYTVKSIAGINYIKPPSKEPLRVELYINQMEKALVTLSQKLTEVVQENSMLKDENSKLLTPKSKKRKKNV